ncbi:unnamed protein product, partial [Porites evermanni]
GSCRYVSSSKSFLFSLYNINDYAPVKVNIKSSLYAIYTCSNYGPTFGNGHDLYLSNNAASNRNSYTYSVVPPNRSPLGTLHLVLSVDFMQGSCKFTPTDVGDTSSILQALLRGK